MVNPIGQIETMLSILSAHAQVTSPHEAGKMPAKADSEKTTIDARRREATTYLDAHRQRTLLVGYGKLDIRHAEYACCRPANSRC